MTINAINPSFTGETTTSRVYRGVKKAVADPTDVNNKDAAIGGAIAAGGVGGTAVVASRLNTMKQMAMSGKTVVTKATKLAAKNKSLLADFAFNLSKFFKETKATAWLARLMNTPTAKKIGGFAGGALALGITAAQLYSAGDMAAEAVDTYKK